jgi:alkylated DNA repair dioxygenase AlkB
MVAEPRLTAWWGLSDELPHPSLSSAWDVLERRYERRFISMGANFYRDGDDSVAWHADRNRREVRHPTIAIVVLGERRSFRLRPIAAGPAPVTLTAGHGDLLVMGGACQHRWQHCVPKTRRPVGPRVSLTFRHVHDDNYDRPPG